MTPTSLQHQDKHLLPSLYQIHTMRKTDIREQESLCLKCVGLKGWIVHQPSKFYHVRWVKDTPFNRNFTSNSSNIWLSCFHTLAVFKNLAFSQSQMEHPLQAEVEELHLSGLLSSKEDQKELKSLVYCWKWTTKNNWSNLGTDTTWPWKPALTTLF